MSFADIIKNNCQAASISWWPKFAYHYTDVANAVNIMRERHLYSRVQASKRGVMKNDNASRQVIDMTESASKTFVRFYFRPLTPTQYYNEGYKHAQLRYDGDANANVPVPIFFVFDLEALLSMPKARFSETSQAGHGASLYQGEAAFKALPFDKIYSNGYCTSDVLPYRHAEIMYPDAFPLDAGLKYIMCRNDLEKLTLMNLLRETDRSLIGTFGNLIKICPTDMFQNNGLFITDIVLHGKAIRLDFSDTFEKNDFTRRQKSRNSVDQLVPIEMRIRFEWVNQENVVVYSLEQEFEVDYAGKGLQLTNFPQTPHAHILRMRIYFDNQFVCLFDQPLYKSELI